MSAVTAWNAGHSIALPRLGFVSLMQAITSIRNWYTKDLSGFEKLILSPLILTVLLLGILNLIVIIFAAPHNWDSMTYHLARVAYYLQHHNLDYFDANYWAQVTHPKNSSLLLLYTYLISWRNENLTQLVQYISYWVAVSGVYAISMKVGNNRAQSIFAAMVSALLIEWLMQATTTQNDLILTAYFGATVYFLFAFRETNKWKYLAFSGLGIGLSVGTKETSFLALPSIGLLALYTLFKPGAGMVLQKRLRNFATWVMCTLLALCMFALPSGYVENYRDFGHPFGPKEIRAEHSFEGQPVDFIIRNGTKNLVRFGSDFLSLDGMPPISIVNKAQIFIRALPEKFVRQLGMELDSPEATRTPFDIQKMPRASEDYSYWGILGFCLVWPAVLLSLAGIIKPIDIRMLSVAAVLFFLIQSYAGPYDIWRGRYFTTVATLAAPIVGVCLQTQKRFLRAYCILIIFAGCISAISAVVLGENSVLVTVDYKNKLMKSTFAMERMEQLTRNRTRYYEPLKRFDELVPNDAVVAAFLYAKSFEYPLFGKQLTRTIMPVNSFIKGIQPIPVNAEYLLYADGFPCARREDIFLGANWYLRHLTDNNRRCN